jgi:hypothetical protein
LGSAWPTTDNSTSKKPLPEAVADVDPAPAEGTPTLDEESGAGPGPDGDAADDAVFPGPFADAVGEAPALGVAVPPLHALSTTTPTPKTKVTALRPIPATVTDAM